MSTLTPEERDLARHVMLIFIEDNREAVEGDNGGTRTSRLYHGACTLVERLTQDLLKEAKEARSVSAQDEYDSAGNRR